LHVLVHTTHRKCGGLAQDRKGGEGRVVKEGWWRNGSDGWPLSLSPSLSPLSLFLPLSVSLSLSLSSPSLPPLSLPSFYSFSLRSPSFRRPSAPPRRRARYSARAAKEGEREWREGVKETEKEREGEEEGERGSAPSEPRKAPCLTVSQGSLSHSLSSLPRFYIPAHLCPLSPPLPSAIRRSLGSRSLSLSLSLSLPLSLPPFLPPSLPPFLPLTSFPRACLSERLTDSASPRPH
jgi:hypothetical protein